MTLELPGYEVIAELGSGASATVYRGVQKALGRQVAIKVLSPGLFDAGETRARFLREARIQAGLSHPNLVALYDAGMIRGSPFVVTELVEGGNLRELLQRAGTLRLPEAVRIGREIASGLAEAHGAGIIHRDLKPENVLLMKDGTAKVADFGLARSREGDPNLLTQIGMIMGTPGYMAPEVLQGAPATAASDIYAIAVMLYEMAAGRRPFAADNLRELLEQQLNGTPPPLGTVCPEAPPALEAVLGRWLAPRPNERPAEASPVAELLGGLELGDGGAMTSPVSTVVHEPGERGERPALHTRNGHAFGERQSPAWPPSRWRSRPRGSRGAGRCGWRSSAVWHCSWQAWERPRTCVLSGAIPHRHRRPQYPICHRMPYLRHQYPRSRTHR